MEYDKASTRSELTGELRDIRQLIAQLKSLEAKHQQIEHRLTASVVRYRRLAETEDWSYYRTQTEYKYPILFSWAISQHQPYSSFIELVPISKIEPEVYGTYLTSTSVKL